MATINEELKAADAAKAAIDGPRSEAINVLRKATQIAAEQFTSFPNEGPLNDARYKVGLVLSPVISALKEGERNQVEKSKDKAKQAIEAWIKELEAAKP